jgi:transketolase
MNGSAEASRALGTLELAHRVRLHALEMTSRGGSSHIGAALSIADILAVLYGSTMRFDPSRPKWPDRDRFILSKGHAGAAVYAVLAQSGFFDPAELVKHCQNGSVLSGHVSSKDVPGVELSTGSLGHGLGVGAGMAYAAKLRAESHRVFVLLSDGECDEGSNWEAILFAGHHKLDNLVAIVDYNKIQSLKKTEDTLGLEPFAEKWRSFRWDVANVDGHDHGALQSALRLQTGCTQPHCIIADTVKGKGVSFMENTVLWHYRTAKGAEYDAALKELQASAPKAAKQ